MQSNVTPRTSDFVTTKEAAARLRVHEVTVRRWIASGYLPATRVGPQGRYRIALADIEREERGA